jgi:hypothetical protein
MEVTAGQLSDDELLAAAPWFHADHVLSMAPPPHPCDWCGKDGGSAAAGWPGCVACGCAGYCGAACAAEAAPHHARNCWKLKLLSKRPVDQHYLHGRLGCPDDHQMFEYE